MDDATLMRGLERRCDLRADSQHVAKRQRAPRQGLGERLAIDQLHDETTDPVELGQLMQRGDVAMIQGSQCPRLAPESDETVGVVAVGRMHHFDRHVAVQGRVVSAVDLAHSAHAEACDDLVGAKSRAWCEPHRG